MTSEVTTRDIYSAILKLHREVEVLKGAKRFISRTQIISEIGETNYNGIAKALAEQWG